MNAPSRIRRDQLGQFLKTGASAQTAKRNREEDASQKALCQWLTLSVRDDVLWHSIPNEGNRGAAQTANLKAMGLLPGAADLLFFWGGNHAALEMKARSGWLQASQETYADRFKRSGGLWAVAYSWPEAARIIRDDWQVPVSPKSPSIPER